MHNDPTKKPEKLKHKLFMMLSLLIEQNSINIALYGLIILIEYYSLLHYSFLSHYIEYQSSKVSAGAYKVFYIFNFIFGLQPSSLIFATVVSIIILGILCALFFVLLIIAKGKKMREKYSVISKSIFKGFGIIYLVIGTALFYPLVYLVGKSFDCMAPASNVIQFYSVRLNLTCWGAPRIGMAAVSGFILLSFLMLLLFLTIMYNDDRPNSSLPWGGKLSLIPIIKIIIKIGMVVLLLVDKKMKARQWSNLAFTILYLLIMFLRFKEPQMRYKIAQYFLMFEEANLFCIYGISTLNMAIEGSEHLLYVILCMCPIIFIAYLYILEWRHSSIITSTLPGYLKSLNDVEYYIDTLIGYLKNTQDNHNYIILTGILITHAKFCEANECVCQKLQEIVNDRSMVKLSSGENKSFYTKNANYHIQYCMKQYEAMFAKNQDKWKQFIKVLLEEAVTNYTKIPRVYIYKSYIEFFLMKNVFMSLYELSNSESYKPALRDQFNIFFQTKIIEDQIMHTRKASIPEISRSIKYLKYYNLFIDEVEQCSSNHSQFWTSLLANQPDPKKLNLLGKEISLNMKKITKIYKKIMKLNEQSMTFLYKYALFLKIIMQDDVGCNQLINKIEQMSGQNIIHDETENDTLRGERLVIRASGEKNSLNKIIDINFQAELILSYSKKDIVGLSGNILMLPTLAENHDTWMRNYYSNLNEKYLNKICTVDLKTKNGNYISCNGLCKMVPNLDNGIEFIQFLTEITQYNCIPAFINKLDKKPALFISDVNKRILGINAECKKYFLLPYSISDSVNTENYLDKIIPEFSKEAERDAMLKRDGSFLQISAQKLIAMAIELYQNDEREATNKDKNVSDLKKQKRFIVWVKLMEEVSGESENQVKTNKLFVIPLTEEEEKKLLSKEDIQKMEITKGEVVESYDSSNEDDDKKMLIEERKESMKHGLKKSRIKSKIKDKKEGLSAVGSTGTSLDSDSKNVREMKLMLNEKGVPRSVKILKRLIISLLIILASLAVVDYVVNKIRVDQIDVNFDRIQTVVTRFSEVSFATFLTRAYTDIHIKMEDNQIVKYSTTLVDNRIDLLTLHLEKLVEMIKDNQNYLEKIQIDLPQAAYDAERKILSLVEYNDKLELSSNKQPLNVGIMQFINKIIYLISLNSTNFTYDESLTFRVNGTTDNKNLSETLRVTEFVVQNGIDSLRNATQESDQTFLMKFLNKARMQRNLLLGLLLSAIILTLICYAFVLPNIIRVAKQKASVTAIFADIPNKDIEAMLNKSQQISIKEAPVDMDIFQEPESSARHNNNNDNSEEKKLDSPINEQNNKSDIKADTSVKDITKADNTMDGMMTPAEIEEQKRKSEEDLKATKKREFLEKSDSSLKRQSLLKITIIIAFFLAYFVFNLVFTYSVYNDFDDASDNLITISKREPYLILQALLVREAIYQGKTQYINSVNSMTYSEYYKQSLDIEDELLLFQKKGSNIFSSYRFMSSSMDDNDKLCEQLANNLSEAIKTQCDSIDSKSLAKGLRNSIFRYMSFISELERNFESDLMKSIGTYSMSDYINESKVYLNDEDVLLSMHILIEYIEPALRMLFDEYMKNAKHYFSLYNLICLLKSLCFLLVLLISYFCIFNTFLNQLKFEIWETNGMLNMIPTKFLLQSKKLKEQFLAHQV